MNLIIDESAKEALKTDLEKSQKHSVRLMIKGFGWAGPSFGLVLDEQGNEDETTEIEGIKFVAEKDIAFLFDNAKVVYRKGMFGSSYDIVTSRGGGSC